MTVTRELLNEKLAEVQVQYTKTLATLEALNGAVQILNHLLELADTPEPIADSKLVEMPVRGPEKPAPA